MLDLGSLFQPKLMATFFQFNGFVRFLQRVGSLVYNHPIGRKNTACIPGIVLAFWQVIESLAPITRTRRIHWSMYHFRRMFFSKQLVKLELSCMFSWKQCLQGISRSKVSCGLFLLIVQFGNLLNQSSLSSWSNIGLTRTIRYIHPTFSVLPAILRTCGGQRSKEYPSAVIGRQRWWRDQDLTCGCNRLGFVFMGI